MRIARGAARLLAAGWLMTAACGAPAQLANLFYNVTGVQTKTLPNAVQITIRTDGTVLFGTDVADLVVFDGANSAHPKETTSLRIRMVRARSRLPGFIDIGAYPVDGVVVTTGDDPLARPFFSPGAAGQPEPRVDLTFRFYVPVRVMRFVVEESSRNSPGTGGGDDWEQEQNSIQFSRYLGQRDVEVKIGPDHRSIVITVITDRVDAGRAANIHRSPAESQNHRLSVTPAGAGRFRVDALHTPLADLLDAYSAAAGTPFVSRSDAAGVDVSVSLPAATPEEFIRAVTVAYGLAVAPRPQAEGGGFSVGRNGPASTTERIALRYLTPTQARMLFPDFLLPTIRADVENNALVVSGSQELIARIRADVAKLDQPRTQVRVTAQAYEVSSADDLDYALNAVRVRGRESEKVDTTTGDVAFRLSGDQTEQVSVAVKALVERGRARLAAEPWTVVASGGQGTLFLGQQRYVAVLQGQWQQTVQALKLQVGYSLTVQPLVGPNGEMTLALQPRVSTVDAVERGTGLPTLGIREIDSVVRLREGDSVLVGVLNVDATYGTRESLTGTRFPGARRRSGSGSAMIVLVTARREG